MRGAAAATARKPKTAWQRLYGHKRPASRWARQRDKRQWGRRVDEACTFGCRHTFPSVGARETHEYQQHRGAWMRRALLQIERDAKWQKFTTDDCRSWAFHPLARRYRRLMRRWWLLDKAEYSAAMNWSPGEGLPKGGPLTRLGEPSAGASGVSWTWYTQPWLKAVEKHWPEKWPAVQAEAERRAAYK